MERLFTKKFVVNDKFSVYDIDFIVKFNAYVYVDKVYDIDDTGETYIKLSIEYDGNVKYGNFLEYDFECSNNIYFLNEYLEYIKSVNTLKEFELFMYKNVDFNNIEEYSIIKTRNVKNGFLINRHTIKKFGFDKIFDDFAEFYDKNEYDDFYYDKDELNEYIYEKCKSVNVFSAIVKKMNKNLIMHTLYLKMF